MERLTRPDVHEATECVVASFDLDPVYIFCFPNKVLRAVFLYSIFGAQILFLNLRTTRVLKDESGRIVSVVVFEDERLNPLLQVLGFVLQSIGMYVLMAKKIALEVAKLGPLGIVTCPLWIPLLVAIGHICMFFFGFQLIRAYASGYKYGRKDGWHRQRKKHLLAIASLPSAQGKGHGSALLRAAFAELEAEQYYGGYYLESSNPRNVPFYERNQFLRLGATRLSGMTITLLVRPDLHRPTPLAQGAPVV